MLGTALSSLHVLSHLILEMVQLIALSQHHLKKHPVLKSWLFPDFMQSDILNIQSYLSPYYVLQAEM